MPVATKGGKATYTTRPREINFTLRNSQGHPFQQKIRTSKAKRLIVKAGRRGAKAQPLTAKVYTPSGPKLMGELKIGDKVLTPKGGVATIEGIFPHDVMDIFSVIFGDGTSAECTADHLWEIEERRTDSLWKIRKRLVTTATLAVMPTVLQKRHGTNRRPTIPTTSSVAYDTHLVPLDPYLLGVLIGDGTMLHESIMFSSKDDYIINQVRQKLPPNVTIKRNRETCDYRLSTGIGGRLNPVIRALKTLGLWGKYSYEKFIPDIYKYNSVDIRLEVIRGLLDTDGWVDHNGQPRFAQTSKQLALDFAETIQSLGGLCTFRTEMGGYPINSVRKQTRTVFRQAVLYNDAPSLFTLPIKRDKCKKRAHSVKRYIHGITHVGKAKVQCIKLSDPQGLYLTDNLIATHNTVGLATRGVEKFLGLEWMLDEQGMWKLALTGKPKRVTYFAPIAEQTDAYWFEVKRALLPGCQVGLYRINETERFIEVPGSKQRIKAKTAYNPDAARGDYGDELQFDEYQLQNEDIWTEVGQPMLMDNNGDAVFAYTPPSLKNDTRSRARDPRHASKMFKKALTDTSGLWDTIHFTSHDNPFISKEGLMLAARDMTLDSYRREIMALDDEVETSWLVYSMFKTETQIINPIPLLPEWPRYVFHDFGCVDEETEILTKRGWKRHNEIQDKEVALTQNPKTGQAEWQSIIRMNRFMGRHDMRLIEQRGHSSFTTHNHRWLVKKRSGRMAFTTTNDLKRNDRVITIKECSNLPTEPFYSNSFVELMGWFWTEGQIDAGGVSIWQNEGEKAEQIRRCLVAEYGKPLTETRNGRERAAAGWVERPKRKNKSPRSGHYTGKELCHFAINLNGAKRVIEVAPGRIVNPEFIIALTASQLKLFIETSIKGDGWNRQGRGGKEAGQSINQSKSIRLDPFQMACSLLGIRSYLLDGKSNGKRSNLSLYKRTSLLLGQSRQKHIIYDGLVWCPTTPNGTWLARRKGTVYFTGNSANPAALFVAQDPATGLFYIYDEYLPGPGRDIYKHTEEWKEKTKGLNVILRIGGNLTTEAETRQGYTAHGWPIVEPKWKPPYQIQLTQLMFDRNKVFVFNRLIKFITELANCMWELDLENKPLDKIKNESRFHLLACARYGFSYFSPETVTTSSPRIPVYYT